MAQQMEIPKVSPWENHGITIAKVQQNLVEQCFIDKKNTGAVPW